MAKMAARCCDLRDHRLLLRRVRATIGVQLVCRSVKMLRPCFLVQDDSLNDLFTDFNGVGPCTVGRGVVHIGDGFDVRP